MDGLSFILITRTDKSSQSGRLSVFSHLFIVSSFSFHPSLTSPFISCIPFSVLKKKKKKTSYVVSKPK